MAIVLELSLDHLHWSFIGPSLIVYVNRFINCLIRFLVFYPIVEPPHNLGKLYILWTSACLRTPDDVTSDESHWIELCTHATAHAQLMFANFGYGKPTCLWSMM